MTVVPDGWVSAEEVSDRVDRLRARYVGNPLVKGIDYRIGSDWSDDPAVFIEVRLAGGEVASKELEHLATSLRSDLLRLVRTDEIGLHSYLNFVN